MGGISRRGAFAFSGLTIWLLALAFVRPLSVDESQYVAASALTAHGLLPYRDYAYLQTPLQPFVFAPLHLLFPGHLLLAIRLANALIGAATAVLVYLTARRIGASERAALIAAALLVTCQSFAWSVGVARNDMLPALLMMLGLFAIAGGRSAFAGIALGLAAGAKISYAVPAAAVFVAIVWTDRKSARWFAVGVAIGLLPSLILIGLAPQAFLAEAIVFPATAPAQYYASIGKAWRLGPARFGQLLMTAAIGPALIAAMEVARRNMWRDPLRRTMLAAAIGGLVSAAVNKPFQIFYLLPALPPLFVLAALLFDQPRPRWLTGAWGLFVLSGLVPVAGWFVKASQGVPALDAERRTHVLAAALHEQHVEGPVATLAGQYVAKVDPRFAGGPFLYRTRGFLSREQAREWHVVTKEEPGTLAETSPSAFVSGSYPDVQPAEELELAAQARALGYRPTGTAEGFTIWTRRP